MHFAKGLIAYQGVRYRLGRSRPGGFRGSRSSRAGKSTSNKGNRREILMATEARDAASLVGRSLVAWGHIYQINTETIPVGSDLKFSNNGRMEGIKHTPGTAAVEVETGGVYGITFSIYTTNSYQDWAVDVNGEEQARYKYGGPVMSNYAQLNLNAGDKITIRNVGTEPDPARLVSGDWTTAYMLVHGYK